MRPETSVRKSSKVALAKSPGQLFGGVRRRLAHGVWLKRPCGRGQSGFRAHGRCVPQRAPRREEVSGFHTQEKEHLMKTAINSVRRLLSDEQGMETVEWGVMAALIVAALVTAISTLGSNVLAKFNGLVDATK
jgi:Flp pilus assembly pilin Flp